MFANLRFSHYIFFPVCVSHIYYHKISPEMLIGNMLFLKLHLFMDEFSWNAAFSQMPGHSG